MIRVEGEPIERKPVTPALRKAVTIAAKASPSKRNGGRAKLHASDADRQRAYRKRKAGT